MSSLNSLKPEQSLVVSETNQAILGHDILSEHLQGLTVW